MNCFTNIRYKLKRHFGRKEKRLLPWFWLLKKLKIGQNKVKIAQFVEMMLCVLQIRSMSSQSTRKLVLKQQNRYFFIYYGISPKCFLIQSVNIVYLLIFLLRLSQNCPQRCILTWFWSLHKVEKIKVQNCNICWNWSIYGPKVL